ncbi:MAG: glycosyltransferase [Thermoplasmata archaeon]
MNESSKIRIIMFKWFIGDGRTGGDKYFISVTEMLSKRFNVELKECFPIKFEGHPRLFSIISIPVSIICANINTFKLLKNGYQVCSLYYSGSIYIVAPPIYNDLAFRFKILFKYYAIVDYISRFGKNNIKLVIYISEYVRSKYKFKKQGIKEYVVYPSVIDKIPKTEFSEKENIIVTVSRIATEKKLEKLITITENLPYKHYLIGFSTDKPYTEKLKLLLKNTTLILDASEEVKNNYLRRAKIFLNTSENEPFGLVLIEAMSHGAIPIAHNSGGPKEILPENFLYSNEDDAKALIIKYMTNYNENIFNELREKAKNFTKEKVEHELYEAVFSTFSNS